MESMHRQDKHADHKLLEYNLDREVQQNPERCSIAQHLWACPGSRPLSGRQWTAPFPEEFSKKLRLWGWSATTNTTLHQLHLSWRKTTFDQWLLGKRGDSQLARQNSLCSNAEQVNRLRVHLHPSNAHSIVVAS